MGHKVHPGGLRVGVIHTWKSNWFTNSKDFSGYLSEDFKIRDHIYGKLSHAGLSDIHIRKDKQKITVDIYTARPGIVIGKSGSEVDALRKELHDMTGKAVQVNITEIKRPELDAKLVAQSIAEQLQNRVSFRRAMKRSLSSSMRSGAQGVKIRCGGRLGGAEMSRSEQLQRGPRAAAHAARRHRLRLRRGQDDLRPDRRQGLDQQGRDHARGLRARRRRHPARRGRHPPPPRRPAGRCRAARPRRPAAAWRWRRWRRRPRRRWTRRRRSRRPWPAWRPRRPGGQGGPGSGGGEPAPGAGGRRARPRRDAAPETPAETAEHRDGQRPRRRHPRLKAPETAAPETAAAPRGPRSRDGSRSRRPPPLSRRHAGGRGRQGG